LTFDNRHAAGNPPLAVAALEVVDVPACGQQVRRTFGDMFFAEVRPFEEIFRPDQSGAAENENQEGNQGVRLAELQKQIVMATWKLQRDKRPNTMKP